MKMFKKFFAFLLLLRQTNFRQQINKILSIVFLLTLVTQIANAQAGEAELPDFNLDGYDWDEYWQTVYEEDNISESGGYIIPSTTETTHTYVSDLWTALDMLNTNYKTYRFDRNGAEECPLFSHHIQGIAYYNGYYYLTRSRKDKPYNEQLLIVDESQAKVVNKMKLDDELHHPSGIQIYDTILVVPFNDRKTNFYSVKDPINPRYLDSIPYKGECAGITEFNGNYLLALFGDRSTITFYLLSSDSLKIIKNLNTEKKIEWKEGNQDKSNWTPYKTWQGTEQHYENMSLIKEQANCSATPRYYLLMYHNDPEAIDVYALSGLDFNNINPPSPPNIQMIRRIEVTTPGLVNSGFRSGGGMYIESPLSLIFFSTRKRIVNRTRINIYK